jgi:chromosome segregation protein
MALTFTRLRLSGFKSFVEPTHVEILPGLTGIVGPNGCGKSNIVEAVRWVMGETSAKSLRGGEMEDVIFAGTATRAQRTSAEVALMLEAPPGAAPAALHAAVNDGRDGPPGPVEIEVHRRIERGHGSTYRVNGKEWRARDVQLLFADSATGARSTAMVSQGKVGAIVNAKPEDRRTLLEEAAGITGLHARRHEAELKLRAAEANLARADDILGTLDAQLATLKKQARQATRYRNIAAQLREAEEALYAARLARAAAAMAAAEAGLREADRAVAEATERAAAAATAAAETEAVLPDLREADAEARAAVERARSDAARLEAEEKAAKAALAAAQARLADLARDLAHAEKLSLDAAEAEQRLSAEDATLAEAEAGAPERIAGATDAAEAASRRVASLEADAQAATERAAEAQAKSNALKQAITAAEQALARLAEQSARLGRERAMLEQQLVEAAALDEAGTALANATAALTAARAEVERAEAARAEAQAAASEAARAAARADAERARLAAEVAALREVLGGRDDELWPKLVDAVTVPEGLETALGAALGEALEAPADEAAPRHWRALPPIVPAQALPEGAVPLATLVKAPPVLARALSQVGLVETGAEGERLWALLRPGQALVSREGAIWRWDGYAVRAGTPTAAATRLAQRNRLAGLRGKLADLDFAASRAKAEHEQAAAAEARALAADQAARNARRLAERALEEARNAHASLTARATAASSRLAALQPQEERLASEQQEAAQRLSMLREQAEALPPLASLQAEVAEARAALSDARRVEAEARAALAVARREAEQVATRRAAIARERMAWAERAAGAGSRGAELATRRTEAEAEAASLAEAPGRLAVARGEALTLLAAAEKARSDSADRLNRAEQEAMAASRALRDAETALAMAREARVRAEGGVLQAEATAADLTQLVTERLGMTAEQLLRDVPVPEPHAEAEAAAAKKLERLARERDQMGPVNLAAEREAEEVEQRIATLNAEREDLTAAIAKLRGAIGTLNREGRERLMACFAEVDRHFQALFTRLFGGGTAHLKMIDSDDPLEAGLEIMASPPGKKLTTLSLLSGGEQALTALSLIFAVFLTNPAPICVLDEVDAPLDDANVGRFCTMLEEIAQSTGTRFLVVTHHRLTMARMDRLYGVTMPERGVSRLVSVDLTVAEGFVAPPMAAE